MIPRWMTGLPGLRVYAALEKSDRSLVAAKEQLRQARADLEAARARADLAGGRVAALSAALDPNQPVIASATKLDDSLHASAESYRAAQPFPHIVIENLVDPFVLDNVLAEFCAADRTRWHHTENNRERKYSTEDEQQ